MGEPKSIKGKKYETFRKELMECFPYVKDMKNVTSTAYLNVLVGGFKKPKPCDHCGDPVNSFKNSKFVSYCSRQCVADATGEKKRETHKKKSRSEVEASNKKRTETVRTKYGVDYISQSKETKEKVKNTSMKVYGVEHPLSAESVRNSITQTVKDKYGVDHISKAAEVKAKKTNEHMKSKEFKAAAKAASIKRYGVDHPMKCEAHRKAVMKTIKERYGVDHISKADVIKAKKIKTSMEKYGVPFTAQLPEVKEKARKTNLKKYGEESYLKTAECRERKIKTCQEKYGVDFVLQSDVVRNKSKSTCENKYGVPHTSQIKIKDSYPILSDKNSLMNHYEGFETITEAALSLNISPSAYGKWLTAHNIEKKVNSRVESRYEREIVKILEDIGVENIEKGKRDILPSGKEIDIYLPDYKFGIEVNGWYWHSDIYKSRDYHQQKSLDAKSVGIKLLHIWEYDWCDDTKKQILIDKIRYNIGCVGSRVYARKCKIIEISNKEATEFYNKTHIQGGVLSKFNYALTHNDEIVTCLSLKQKPKEPDTLNITRYATSCSVVGGFSKLIKHIAKKHDHSKITTFASLDYGTGEMYEKCGFTKIDITKPNYKYVRKGVVLSREKCMKHKLKDKLDAFDETLTEYENMSRHGFYRVFDAGSIRYEMSLK